MSSDDIDKRLNALLTILSKPLSRYILAVLAGMDPRIFTDTNDGNNNEDMNYDS